MALCSASGGTTLFPASDRGVFDVSGAGDTVSAVVALALALGASMSDAVVLANGAAAVQVSKAGVATVTREELYEYASTLTTAREVGGTPREVAELPRGERSSRELSGTPER